jgi:hypothetical protein
MPVSETAQSSASKPCSKAMPIVAPASFQFAVLIQIKTEYPRPCIFSE